MVLARVLTPADFGLLASVMPVVGFVAMFKDMGLSMATVQRPEINHQQVSALFWLNLGISILLVAACWLLAPAAATFYDDPRATSVIQALSLAFLLSGISVQHQALLERRMRFAVISSVDLLASSVAIAVAILLSVQGFGYWSLVSMSLVAPLVQAPLVWWFVGWIPGRPGWNREIVGMVRMGGNLTGFSLMNFVGRNVDNVMIAKVWGDAAVGLYSKAYSLLLLPLQQISGPMTAVAVPGMCLLLEERERYRSYYRNALEIVASMSLPLICYILISAAPIVQIVLGDQWTEASRIFEYLCLASITQVIYTTAGWVFRSTGRTDKMFRWSIVSVMLTIFAFVMGIEHGATGVAAAYSLVNVVLFFPAMAYAFHGTPIQMKDVWAATRAAALTCVLLITMILPVRLLAPEFSQTGLFLLASTPLAAVSWLAGNRLFSRGGTWLGPLMELRHLRSRG